MKCSEVLPNVSKCLTSYKMLYNVQKRFEVLKVHYSRSKGRKPISSALKCLVCLMILNSRMPSGKGAEVHQGVSMYRKMLFEGFFSYVLYRGY